MTMRDGDPRPASSGRTRLLSPFAALVVAVLAIVVFGYNFGDQPSNSEKYGTITESEAQDGVTPSLSPDGSANTSEQPDTLSSVP